MNLLQINWLAVFVASLSTFAIGAIWFGPKTFYPIWIRALGRQVPTERVEMKGSETFAMFFGTYLGGLAQAATLGFVISIARSAAEGFNFAAGAFMGFILAIGIGAAASLGHRLFGQANFKVFAGFKVWIIEVGADIVALTIAGAIIGA
ncbi:MAG: DUF1761 domain-containing protein, partial [Rhodoluna sp.]